MIQQLTSAHVLYSFFVFFTFQSAFMAFHSDEADLFIFFFKG